MTMLQLIGFIIGGLAIASGVLIFSKPQTILDAIKVFPRSKYPAWIFTTINMIWASKLCSEMYLGWFDAYKWVFYILGAFSIFAIIKFLDELLAPRMLGGFLLLVAAPCLKVARFFPTPMDPSPWRVIISGICYLWIIYGIYLLCCPWGFRKTCAIWLKFDKTMKLGGLIKITTGIALIIISAIQYGN